MGWLVMGDELCPVTLRGLAEDRLGYEFALLEDDRGRQLPIWIGRCEAYAIQIKLQQLAMPRPMTHELLCQTLAKLGGTVTRMLVDDLWQNIFYAKLCVRRDGEEEEIQVDCRPADGLAIALRIGAPIVVRDDVLEEGKVTLPLDGETDQDVPDNDT